MSALLETNIVAPIAPVGRYLVAGLLLRKPSYVLDDDFQELREAKERASRLNEDMAFHEDAPYYEVFNDQGRTMK